MVSKKIGRTSIPYEPRVHILSFIGVHHIMAILNKMRNSEGRNIFPITCRNCGNSFTRTKNGDGDYRIVCTAKHHQNKCSNSCTAVMGKAFLINLYDNGILKVISSDNEGKEITGETIAEIIKKIDKKEVDILKKYPHIKLRSKTTKKAIVSSSSMDIEMEDCSVINNENLNEKSLYNIIGKEYYYRFKDYKLIFKIGDAVIDINKDLEIEKENVERNGGNFTINFETFYPIFPSRSSSTLKTTSASLRDYFWCKYDFIRKNKDDFSMDCSDEEKSSLQKTIKELYFTDNLLENSKKKKKTASKSSKSVKCLLNSLEGNENSNYEDFPSNDKNENDFIYKKTFELEKKLKNIYEIINILDDDISVSKLNYEKT
ncbi:hypothetical protein BCR32DRAFT_298515 [Anaeromyces robustus]|uniref:Uncharacterized protein n=1 Tax=Anaeromyces robustus TaxID=1754192 RepID=A0A1Y1VPG2_9FUNG|nr:hypothetical protein BCR32DRAFT_298515 [Anaeromyces robustus]|eukprot:ORX62492.1 hypothetical protein BCR32DRAFT_298515 [Anaeromyces robustus]